MTGLPTVINCSQRKFYQSPAFLLALAGLVCALLNSPSAYSQSEDLEPRLQALTAEREMLSKELEQYRSTVGILHRDNSPPEQSSNPAVQLDCFGLFTSATILCTL